ncbi:MAG: penicillin-binding protein 1C [Treponema sp.]|nr:penicillin-binding protein 1C [Treponema sp.]
MKKYRCLKVLILAAVIFFAAIILMNIILALIPFPELKTFQSRSYGLVVQDKNGILLRVIPSRDGVKREWLSLEQIPPGVTRTFIRAEDRRFYFHPGIDVLSVAASAWRNFRAGEIVSGASTITMQLARIVKPHQEGLKGKMIEAWDALRLEAKLSKREILELWLNNIPFGSNIEGLGAMARNRFGLEVNQLDDAHAAVLAVIPRRPSLFDPLYNEDASLQASMELAQRCNLHIDEETLRSVIAGIKHVNEDDRTPFRAPHFTDRISNLVQEENDSSTRVVTSTLDLRMQTFAEQQLENELVQLSGNRVGNGAILLIENETGNVLAYVGSKSWFDEDTQGKIDGIRVLNQPGSCLKPFLYAMALDAGLGPNEILPDLPSVFGGSEGYIPSNFDRRFNGPVRMRVSLASSLNIPAVYTLERLGVNRFEQFLKSLGFDSIAEKMGTHGTGLALGNAEVSLEEMVGAFAAFPRGGIPATLQFYETTGSLREPQGPTQAQGPSSVMSAETAWVICDILSDRASRFPGFGPAPVFQLPFPVMFKTGTSNQFQNIWALAATEKYTVGVWMGNFSGETVVGTTGSAIPARIAANILNQLESSGSSSYSDHVGGAVPLGLAEADICPLSGMLASSLCTGSVREWFPDNEMPRLCSWHTSSGLVYPSEYQSWIVERFRIAETSHDQYQSVGIRIPVSGSVFYIDPSYPASAQAVRIETYGFENDAQIFVNSTFAGTINQAGVFMLPLERGKHFVKVEDDSGNYAFVEIEVR